MADDNDKKICIETGVFDIQFYWNSKTVGIHTGLFIGLLALSIVTKEASIHKLCVLFFVIELLTIVFLIIRGLNYHVEDPSSQRTGNNPEHVQQSNLDVEVSHDKQKREKPKTKTSNEKEGTISNKVPSPNPSSCSPKDSEPAQPVEDIVASAGEPSKSTEDDIAAMSEKFSSGTMSEQDWDDLFNM